VETTTDLVTWWGDFARSLRRRQRSERTVRIYRQSFDYFWSFAQAQGVSEPGEVTRDLVNAWVEHEQGKGVTPTTVALRWRNLRPFFSWWAREVEAPNPMAGADVPSAPTDPPPVIALDDIRAMLKACGGRGFACKRDEAIIRLLYDTGCRLGELLNLTVDDWDRRTDFLTLRGKTGVRVVDLSASTGEALARYVRTRAGHPKAPGTDALWLGTKGPLTANGVGQLLDRRARQAGVRHVHPHLFRHTFAHQYRAQGGSEGDLMYLAGWRSTAMAHRYGASAAAQRAREAHRRLGLADAL
jgi:site-specific recombinase XerD